ncbi:MAG TPA: outer membrane beta-barrel protein [Saprospiraceae bacterium]|nr:outer membrane beta-barrel protein [Saprospiraceae bacterium]
MRNLYSIQVALILVLSLLYGLRTEAQRNAGGYNYLDFESKNYYFGLTIGYNSSNFQMLHSKRFILNDSFSIADPKPGSGFNVSMVTNLKIGDHFDLRFLPGFSFAERNIVFKEVSNGMTENIRTIESVFVQAPFQVRFKSAPYRDLRVFVLGGVKYTYDVASNARVRRELANALIKISPHDFAVEVGAGVQFFMPYFIFSPEIKFSQGINNILIYNDGLEQSRVIEKILSRTLTISLHFEG